MAELEIRAARQADLDRMIAIDHASKSAYAYKMEVLDDKDNFSRSFQRIHLPRAVTLSYPKDEEALLASWNEADAIFVGCVLDEVIAYVALELRRFRATARVSDLVVAQGLRRKGIGSRMLLAGEAWAHDRGAYRILTELQIRNDPAIKMMLKLGYQLCGYVDQYFPNQEMALFFEKRV